MKETYLKPEIIEEQDLERRLVYADPRVEGSRPPCSTLVD